MTESLYSDVQQAEAAALAKRRATHNQQVKLALDASRQQTPDGQQQQDLQAATEQLARETSAPFATIGLAFSGGGIRSATFNLGVLQGLAKLKLLGWIDYLSAVSGGGYIASWFSAWVHRTGDLNEVQERLANPPRPDPMPSTELRPIQHLRRYSNYLAPQRGFLALDTLVLMTTYLRNFLLNQLVLFPAIIILLLISRLMMTLYHPQLRFLPEVAEWVLYLGIFTGLCAMLWVFCCALAVRDTGADPAPVSENRLDTPRMLWQIAVPLLLAALLICLLITPQRFDNECGCFRWFDELDLRIQQLLIPLLPGFWSWLAQTEGALVRYWSYFALATSLFGGLVAALSLLLGHKHARTKPWGRFIIFSFCASLLGSSLLFGIAYWLKQIYDPEQVGAPISSAALMTTCGPPLVLLCVIISIFIAVGLLKRRIHEGLREWWICVCAQLLVVGALWLALNALSIYATVALIWMGPWLKTLLGTGWLMTVAGGVMAGSSAATDAKKSGQGFADWYAFLAPYCFVAGVLVLCSYGMHVVMDGPSHLDAYEVFEATHKRTKEAVEQSGTREPGKITVKRTWETVDSEEAKRREEKYWFSLIQFTDRYTIDKPDIEPLQADTARIKALEKALNGLLDKSAKSKLELVSEVRLPFDSAFKKDYIEEAAQRLMDEREELPVLVNKLDAVAKEVLANLPTEYKRSLKQPENARNLQRLKTLIGARIDAITAGWVSRVVSELIQPDLTRMVFLRLGGALLACLLVLALFSGRLDVNAFSLRAMYGNRLIRAYLGASRPDKANEANTNRPRSPDPITAFDPDDDFPLSDLSTDAAPGPYLLINTAINLVQGDELAWQERKAAPFLFSPAYCGSDLTDYRPSASYADNFTGKGITLGEAMTISGAAANPNMGYNSSPAVTALLTIFNARLGAWLGNPRHPTTWRHPGPRFGFVYLLAELFGMTNEKSRYVNLSDGGHFDNLGVYELVKRRCKLIIAVDAAQDSKHGFEDLGSLIRKVRIDLHASININVVSLQHQKDSKRTTAHYAVGLIHYDDDSTGTLLYLKPALTGDEEIDVLDYANRHPEFPHETTVDQFFSESQFESYRALGCHSVWKALAFLAQANISSSQALVQAIKAQFARELEELQLRAHTNKLAEEDKPAAT